MTDDAVADGRELLRLALDGHGGEERWRAVQALELRYTAGGLAWAMKLRGLRQKQFDARVDPREPRVTLRSFPRAGRRGVLDGRAVRIETDVGEPAGARDEPAREYRRPRRLVYWDDLDLLYFSAYAIWGYATAPFHLTRPGIELAELPPWREDDEEWRRVHPRRGDGRPRRAVTIIAIAVESVAVE